MTDKQPEARSDIDYLYTAVTADTDALEDAKMTLEVIKETDPGVYNEMINDTLALIRKALSSSIIGVIEKTDAELRRLHEVNAELVEALWELVKWYAARDEDDVLLPDRNQNPEICQAMQALAKAQGDNNG